MVYVVAVLVFIGCGGLLSLGIIMKKKTPLKSGCASLENHPETGEKEHVCEGCSCGNVPAR